MLDSIASGSSMAATLLPHAARAALLVVVLAPVPAAPAATPATEQVAPQVALPPAPAAHETAAAREQARLCERKSLEEGAAACRAALALGIGPARRGAMREKLARHLVGLEKWDELVALFREMAQLEPQNGMAWYRLGSTLLFALGQPAEALPALQQAARLGSADAPTDVALGTALEALGRHPEAVAAFEEALRYDPAVLDSRPGAKDVLEAARAGKPWP